MTAVVVDGCGAPQHALSVTGLARGVLSLVEAPEGSRDRSVADAMRATRGSSPGPAARTPT